jgi:23S rRNA (adenine2503-C2)-methyltransferase
LGEREFRAAQVSQHSFGRLVRDPAQMSDVPSAVRERLAGALMPPLLNPVRELECDDGATRKSLWRLHDGSLVESVLMGYPDRVTVCVSSQAGCGMGCPFCATGQAGLTRNRSTAEIVDQVVWFAGVAASGAVSGSPPRLSHVVFMGMGEPLANYSRVIEAVRRLVAPAPEGLGLSQRHITVSTVGLVPAIRRLADEDLAVTLALSLHAPDDDLRDELVPINQRWKVAEVLQAAWDYTARTGRRVSIEYALIRDVNDQGWRADLLGRLLAGKTAHVNLIPLNPTPGSRWDASPKPVEREFVRRLRAAGVPTTVRDTRGREIDGACGQLAASENEPRKARALVGADKARIEGHQARIRTARTPGRRGKAEQ